MKHLKIVLTASMAVAGIAIVGCKSSTPPGSPSPSTEPTAILAPQTNGPMVGAMPTTLPAPSASQTEVVLPAGTPPAAKDLTHTLTKDEPFFLNEPGASPKPIGTLKAGTKVLVLIPGAEYSQVMTDKGITAYVPTDGLQPLGK